MLHRKTILSAAAVPAMAALGFGALAVAPAAHAAQATATAVNVAATSSRPLTTGDRGSDVQAWQQDIDRVSGKIPGVPRIATDASYGPATTAATKDFQRFAHLSIDGVVGPHTRAAMNTALHGAPAPSGTTAPILRLGDRGQTVRVWQQDIDRVAGKIPGVPHIATDASYGPATTAATKDFQRFAHLSIDGVVGPHTRAAMNTALHGSQH